MGERDRATIKGGGMAIEPCEWKASYRTVNEDLRVSKIVNRRKKNKETNHAPAHVYKCPNCGKYHITGRKATKIPVKEL